ncbi:uncharacterized protein LOC124204367 [Daphnia pulex]|jgi:hypothetical protein|uniref:uncharacterized protein LOC124204367 n=1 Tax=Daphnia pulex TaxID=6669 RepID=UPI001EE11BBF|nr:uncharacterized protein LOC124204367 [Daphnia pulex]
MEFILTTVLSLVLAISMTHGAAIAAIGSPTAVAASSGRNMITTTAGVTNSRTGRQQQQEEPLMTVNVLESNNEPIFRTQPGFPAVFHPGNDYQLKTSGNFAIVDTGVVFWGIAGILGLAVAVWIVSLFSGLGFFKTILTGFHSVKGRADEMGFKMDSQKLNMVANQVYKAIESYRAKNQ